MLAGVDCGVSVGRGVTSERGGPCCGPGEPQLGAAAAMTGEWNTAHGFTGKMLWDEPGWQAGPGLRHLVNLPGRAWWRPSLLRARPVLLRPIL